jgi:NAD(P)-dependent dehydrogenase (short-subunit alcohol dehydrogenase family)
VPATAEKLAAAGFTVVGVDRNEAALRELPDGIRHAAGDPAVSRSLDDKIAAEVGSPEALVNTIATYHLGEALTGTSEDLRFMIDVNVGTALWLTQAVAPYMRERGSGAVVHVAARPGLEPTAGMATYGVSKAAPIHLTRVLDLALRPPLDVAGRRRTTTARHGLEPGVSACRTARVSVSPAAVTDIIVYLVCDAAAPASGAVVPAQCA